MIIVITFIIILIMIAVFAVSEYENKKLESAEYVIKTKNTGCRIVFLSDMHNNQFGKDNEMLVKAVKKIDPDIVLIGGDMPIVKNPENAGYMTSEKLIKELTDSYPVYYAMGNHEQRMQKYTDKYDGWWKNYKKMLADNNVKLLDNEKAYLNINDAKLCIYGVSIDEAYYKKGSRKKMNKDYIDKLIGKADRDCFNILLAHNPMYLDGYVQWGADLVLSGHFHGGLVRLPLLGGVITPQFQLFSKYCRGRLEKGKTIMLVSGGLGTHSINIRINNRPQIVDVLLEKEN